MAKTLQTKHTFALFARLLCLLVELTRSRHDGFYRRYTVYMALGRKFVEKNIITLYAS